MDAGPGTIVVYSDIGCPWSHLAVFRLLRARRVAGLDDDVVLDHRPFLLEELKHPPTPRKILEAEIPVLASLEPDAGWQVWPGSPYEWPVSTMTAAEAVQAAKSQSPRASEALDRALRVAFFRDGRCITLRHVVVDVARETDGVDADAVGCALDDGSARATLMREFAAARDAAKGSPHVFLPDGTDVLNPGVEMHWEGEHGHGFPQVDKDDPGACDDLVRRAAKGR
jgi:predicted DsbA family dithiol-disulfide isomerase